MKKLVIIVFFSILALPFVFYTFCCFYNRLHVHGRHFTASLTAMNVNIGIKEIRQDSILSFCVSKVGSHRKPIEFLIHNSCFDVVSLVSIEGNDTVYIRKGIDFNDLVSPGEDESDNAVPRLFEIDNPVAELQSSRCRLISFSDKRFFFYDKGKRQYVPKDKRIHMIKLYHDIERADSYHLYDITLTDTVEIKLSEL